MDAVVVAASTDDEMLSAMSALAQLITNIDLVGTINPVRVETGDWTEMKFTGIFFEGPGFVGALSICFQMKLVDWRQSD
jgi:hypothetical protein